MSIFFNKQRDCSYFNFSMRSPSIANQYGLSNLYKRNIRRGGVFKSYFSWVEFISCLNIYTTKSPLTEINETIEKAAPTMCGGENVSFTNITSDLTEVIVI